MDNSQSDGVALRAASKKKELDALAVVVDVEDGGDKAAVEDLKEMERRRKSAESLELGEDLEQ